MSPLSRPPHLPLPLPTIISFTYAQLFLRPAYLIVNVTGPPIYKGKNANHFDPRSALWEGEGARAFWQVCVSTFGVLLALSGVGYAMSTFGVMTVLAFYVMPYLVVNMNLVLITFLQHTDVAVPHYREKDFSWVRGALCTVDRSYGWLLDHVFHHISDTHVVHHLFHTMPFYHAREATMAVREKLGAYYLADHTPIPTALYKSMSQCVYIDDSGGTVFFKNCSQFNAELKKNA